MTSAYPLNHPSLCRERPGHTVISNGAGRRFFFRIRSCDCVGLHREKSLFLFRQCGTIETLSSRVLRPSGGLAQQWSSGLALPTELFFGDELFHSSGNFVVFKHFSGVDLRQAFFHLADKPLIVTNQALNRFMHQRRAIAPLLAAMLSSLACSSGESFAIGDETNCRCVIDC